MRHAEVVVCGAGIAGIAAAWYLVVRAGVRNVVLVEEGAPLSLTSDKSTECYRNWWPGPDPTMTTYMNRSIDLLEELANATGNRFLLDRRGYLFATARAAQAERFESEARLAEAHGAGALRVHSGDRHSAGNAAAYQPACANGFADQADGADLIVDSALIRRAFPYLDERTVAVLHARRCGGLSAQQLGMTLLEQARAAGLELLHGKVVAVDTRGGRVQGVDVNTRHGDERIVVPTFVNAAGPYAGAVARLLGIDLPVQCERHVKLTFDDRAGVVPRHAPLLLWCDSLRLPWSADEREALCDAPDMLEEFPAGVHGRPLGAGQSLALYWTYDCPLEDPTFPLQWDPHKPEIYLRGMSVMLPGLQRYFAHMPNAYVDGGYYTKTADNRPLIGALPVAGAHACTAFSGFGIMAALAGAELLSASVTGAERPAYASAFAPARFDDGRYVAELGGKQAAGAGQL